MVSGSVWSMATEPTLRRSGCPSGLMRRQVRPPSRERYTPVSVPATSEFASEGACASARTDCPSMPGRSEKVTPPSTLRATPPPEPPTSQKPASTTPRASTRMSSMLPPRMGNPGVRRPPVEARVVGPVQHAVGRAEVDAAWARAGRSPASARRPPAARRGPRSAPARTARPPPAPPAARRASGLRSEAWGIPGTWPLKELYQMSRTRPIGKYDRIQDLATPVPTKRPFA